MPMTRRYQLAVQSGDDAPQDIGSSYPLRAFLACHDKEKYDEDSEKRRENEKQRTSFGCERGRRSKMDEIKHNYIFWDLDGWNEHRASKSPTLDSIHSQHDDTEAEWDNSHSESPTCKSSPTHGKKHLRRNSTAIKFTKPEYLSHYE